MPGYRGRPGPGSRLRSSSRQGAAGPGWLCRRSGLAEHVVQLRRDAVRPAPRRVLARAVAGRTWASTSSSTGWTARPTSRRSTPETTTWRSAAGPPTTRIRRTGSPRCSAARAATTRFNYCNPAFDQLVARADGASSQVDRLARYRQAQAMLLQAVPVVPLYVRGHLVLIKPWVAGERRRSAAHHRPGRFPRQPVPRLGSRSCPLIEASGSMTRFIIRRILWLIPVLLFVSLITFT